MFNRLLIKGSFYSLIPMLWGSILAGCGSDSFRKSDASVNTIITNDDLQVNKDVFYQIRDKKASENMLRALDATKPYWDQVRSLQKKYINEGVYFVKHPLPEDFLPATFHGKKLESIPQVTGGSTEMSRSFYQYGNDIGIDCILSARGLVSFNQFDSFFSRSMMPMNVISQSMPNANALVLKQEQVPLTEEQKKLLQQLEQSTTSWYEALVFANGYTAFNVIVKAQVPEDQQKKLLDEFLTTINYKAIDEKMKNQRSEK